MRQSAGLRNRRMAMPAHGAFRPTPAPALIHPRRRGSDKPTLSDRLRVQYARAIPSQDRSKLRDAIIVTYGLTRVVAYLQRSNARDPRVTIPPNSGLHPTASDDEICTAALTAARRDLPRLFYRAGNEINHNGAETRHYTLSAGLSKT
jgi:hypothetical protein